MCIRQSLPKLNVYIQSLPYLQIQKLFHKTEAINVSKHA